MSPHVTLRDITIGYEKKSVVSGIDLDFLEGKMTCILGPNGSGKTTLLLTVARLLHPLAGQLLLSGQDLRSIPAGVLSQQLAVVLTQRLDLENMTGREVVALGRYPHTGFFGVLTPSDATTVQTCIELCQAEHLAERLFNQMSDGEKQRILIARALAQEPKLLVLDEPTMHLDLRHKIEILALLQRLALEQGITVLLTLHEPDLALKACDQLVLVKDGQIIASGANDTVVKSEAFDVLYGISGAGFDPLTCGIEFPATKTRDVFIIGGGAIATPYYRACARLGIGFASGVLHADSLDYFTSVNMGAPVVSVPAFATIAAADIAAATTLAKQYRFILDSGCPWGDSNRLNGKLLELGRQQKNLLSLRKELPLGAERLHTLEDLATRLRTSNKE